MKKILLVAICIFMVSCTSKQHKAEKLVKTYLNQHLNDPGSYENVNFSELDTLFKRYSETKQCDSLKLADAAAKQKVEKIKDTIINLISTSKTSYMEALKRQMKYEADTGALAKTIRSNELLFKGPVKGWSISNTYRAKNAHGVLVLHNSHFQLDSTLTRVVYASDLK